MRERQPFDAQLAVVLAVALALRLARLSNSLWLDEGLSLAAARDSAGIDAGRPLYFWFLKAWSTLANGEIWLRVPSVICGLGSVAVAYVLAKSLAGRTVAGITGLLMALSTPQIFHSQEVRMYTVGPFLLLAAAYLLWRWWVQGGWGALVGHAAMAYCALLTAPQAMLGLVAIWCGCLWQVRVSRPRRSGLMIAIAGTLVAWLPFAMRLAQNPEATDWIARPGLDSPFTLQAWALVSEGLALLPLPGRALLTSWRVLGLLVTGIAALAALDARWRKVAFGYGAIVALVFLSSRLVRPIWVYRYFMPYLPALYLLTALGFERIRRTSAAAFHALLWSLFAVELTCSIAQARSGPIEDWRGAANSVAALAAPGDIVVVPGTTLSDGHTGVWSYYYHGRAEVMYRPGSRDGGVSWPTELAEIRARQPSSSRLWLVLRSSTLGSRRDALAANLRERLGAQRSELTGIDLYRLGR